MEINGAIEILDKYTGTFLSEDRQTLERYFDTSWKDWSLKKRAEQMESLLRELPRLPEWIDFREVTHEAEWSALGLQKILDDILNGALATSEAEGTFEVVFWEKWLEMVYAHIPELRYFRLEDHEQRIDEFQRLDHEIIERAFQRIRQKLLSESDRPSLNQCFVADSSELGILKRELEKRRRRLPIRQLFQKVPRMLMRLKPCLMMSPLAVSTYLDSDDYYFDLVIFDEASQVCPWDAIGAIYRGKQLIVAGDQKQLPPSRYFERRSGEDESAESEDDAMESMENYESILDMCCPIMNRVRLKWHYRSRREPLITFSNVQFYDNELITFPSVEDSGSVPAVRFHYVPEGVWQSRMNQREAEATAELVRQHIEESPDKSLGVVTFSITQQDAVQDAVETMRESHPELDFFFQETSQAPFFVKNLETVQGDERDRMILCVGYARDAQGKLAMRFGPLNQAGGQRRLNVAITRAKYGVTLVSSLRASDITETKYEGPQLLRSYLEYAEKGPKVLREVTDTSTNQKAIMESESPFEAEVEQALRAKGLVVHRQVGCSGFRIDLALLDPERPDRYLLGIECDGATYHQSATARDRDRLRQEVLSGLGWTICRIWSTDWWTNPKNQMQRVLQMYEKAKRQVSDPEKKAALRSAKTESIRREVMREIPRKISTSPHSVTQLSFNNIDDVPTETIRSQALAILACNGRIRTEAILGPLCRSLGFNRLGSKIQSRLTAVLRKMMKEGLIPPDET